MVVLNKTFSKQVMNKAVSDIFHATANIDNSGVALDTTATPIVDNIIDTNDKASDSSILSTLSPALSSPSYVGITSANNTGGAAYSTLFSNLYNNTISNDYQLNFKIVTSKFLKVWDKIQSKVWNESFQESGFYNLNNYITLPVGLMRNQDTHFMALIRLVDRMILVGELEESDRLHKYDVLDIRNLTKNTTIMNTDTSLQTITLKLTKSMDIVPDIYTEASSGINEPTEEELYLKDKELYLFYTPHVPNYHTLLKDRANQYQQIGSITSDYPYQRKIPESFSNRIEYGCSYYNTTIYNAFGIFYSQYRQFSVTIDADKKNLVNYSKPLYRPFNFFKPKEQFDENNKPIVSKWGQSLPMSTHLIWRIGTSEQYEEAIEKGYPKWRTPEIIIDHVDRISHIDSFEMTIKYDAVIF